MPATATEPSPADAEVPERLVVPLKRPLVGRQRGSMIGAGVAVAAIFVVTLLNGHIEKVLSGRGLIGLVIAAGMGGIAGAAALPLLNRKVGQLRFDRIAHTLEASWPTGAASIDLSKPFLFETGWHVMGGVGFFLVDVLVQQGPSAVSFAYVSGNRKPGLEPSRRAGAFLTHPKAAAVQAYLSSIAS